MRTIKLKLSTLAVFFALVFLSPGLFSASEPFSQTPSTATNAGPMISATISTQSSNWGGYAATGSGVSYVGGSWTQPSVSCATKGSAYVSIWVGIDGFNSGTVEQTGTTAQCSSGKATYWAWYEFFPKFSVTIGSITVKPGDKFTATVTYSSTTKIFTTKITDTSTSKTYSKSSTLSKALRSSAEWIVERPEICNPACSFSTLADFHSATFTLASATISATTGSISKFTNYAITMVSSEILAKPSALSSGGTSFTMTYVS